MATLLLVRHGHTDAAGKRLTGWAAGVHLNETGRQQAEHLIKRLDGIRVDAIYSSPLERCRETAAPLAKARRLGVHIRRRLIETGYGEWTGRSIAQVRKTKLWRTVERVPSAMRFPGGESLLEVQARAVDEVNRIAQVAGADVDHLHRLVVDTCSITAVALDDAVPRLLKVNDTGDLAGLRSRSRKVGG